MFHTYRVTNFKLKRCLRYMQRGLNIPRLLRGMWLTGTEHLRGPHADLDSICCQLSGRDRRHLAVLSDASNGGECAACDGINTPHDGCCQNVEVIAFRVLVLTNFCFITSPIVLENRSAIFFLKHFL